MNETGQLLLSEEVATRLRVPINHIYRLARRGEIASVKIGRYVRFEEQEVERYISSNIKAAS